MVWKIKFPNLNFFPDLAENLPFSPDIPDWKKSSKFSLISLIGGNPAPVTILVPQQILESVLFVFLNIPSRVTERLRLKSGGRRQEKKATNGNDSSCATD